MVSDYTADTFYMNFVASNINYCLYYIRTISQDLVKVTSRNDNTTKMIHWHFVFFSLYKSTYPLEQENEKKHVENMQ